MTAALGVGRSSFATVPELLRHFPNPAVISIEQVGRVLGISRDDAGLLRGLAIEQLTRAACAPPTPQPEPVLAVMGALGVNAEEARVWLNMKGKGYV